MLMVMTPDWINAAMLAAAVEKVALKGGAARLGDVCLEMRMVGQHHEPYFSDIRRVASQKRRTILRQPGCGWRAYCP